MLYEVITAGVHGPAGHLHGRPGHRPIRHASDLGRNGGGGLPELHLPRWGHLQVDGRGPELGAEGVGGDSGSYNFV